MGEPAERSLRSRAVVAVALLFGFYVLVLVVTAGLVAATVYELATGVVFLYLLVATGAAVFGLLPVLFSLDGRAATLKIQGAVELTRAGQPDLFAFIDEIAAACGTTTPETVFLDGQVNAGVLQTGRLLGLVGGRRYLMLGLPVLAALPREQLRGVLAHEFGHFTGGDARLSAILYRGSLAISRARANVRNILIREVVDSYAQLFYKIVRPVNRQREYAADRLAAGVCGAPLVAGTLLHMHVVERGWRDMQRRYLAPAALRGVVVSDACTALADSIRLRPAAAQQAVSAALATPARPGDSHPAPAARVAALGGAEWVLPEGEPVVDLLRDREAVEEQVARALLRLVVTKGTGRVLPLAEAADEVWEHLERRAADDLLRASAALAAGTRTSRTTASLADLAAQLESGRALTLARYVDVPLRGVKLDQQDATRLQWLRASVRSTLAQAAIAQGRATRAVALASERGVAYVGGNGKPLPLQEFARGLVAGGDEAAAVRRRLARARISLDWTPGPLEVSTAELGRLVLR